MGAVLGAVLGVVMGVVMGVVLVFLVPSSSGVRGQVMDVVARLLARGRLPTSMAAESTSSPLARSLASAG